jgi:ABC-type antimicrobial peptide transport system permease subunit
MHLLIVTVRIALRALRRNTLRSLLTILGIIIGVAAVIAMVSIGQGASVAVQEQIARMGNNMLVILSGSVTQGGVRTGAGGRSTLRVGDAKAIQRECPAVSAVTYLRRQVQQVVVGNQNWSTSVSGVTPEFIPEAERQIKTLLRERHRLKSNQDDDFMIRNLADVAATAQSTNQSMSILLASVASVSLLVGGIGIMNIMLVSVTERTREIGIRMAVGAKRQDILTQFLLEAVVLSTLGGLFGVVLGVVGSQLVSAIAEWPTIVPIEAIVLAVVFSGAVGIFFGFYPARKAAHLDPIQALRYE